MSEKKILEHYETNSFVVTVAQKCLDVINEEIEKIHERQRWVLFARIINLLFSKFYVTNINKAELTIDEPI